MIRFFSVCLLVLVCLQCQLWGCQYTVRDIGYVDLRGAEYTLVITCPKHLQSQLGDWDYLDDTNVKMMFDSAGQTTTVKNETSQCQVELVDALGRRLLVGEFDRDFQNVSQSVFERLFGSPTISRLRRKAIPSFVQIVVFNVGDDRSIERAKSTVDEAVKAIKRIEPMLPRPLSRPIDVIHVSAEELANEALLGWCLGINNEPHVEPAVAVVYGRAKLAGKVLRGDNISSRELLSQLALVGESCECETDRSWNDELVLPFYWPTEFRKTASSSLGFDPESPLVQAEIARIIQRGPTDIRQPGSRTGDGVDDIEQLLLGYEERTIRSGNGLQETTRDGDSHQNSEASSDVAVVLQTGDGWGFEEAAPDETVNDPSFSETENTVSNGLANLSTDPVDKTASESSNRLSAIFYVLGGLAGSLLILSFLIQWLIRT